MHQATHEGTSLEEQAPPTIGDPTNEASDVWKYIGTDSIIYILTEGATLFFAANGNL